MRFQRALRGPAASAAFAVFFASLAGHAQPAPARGGARSPARAPAPAATPAGAPSGPLTHDPVEALKKAREQGRAGQYVEAIRQLEAVEPQAKDAVGRDIRILLGEYLIATGHRQDAETPLMKVVGAYNNGDIQDRDAAGLAQVGRAAYLLRSPKDANQAFNESERIDKKNVRMLLWRGELFLDKYDPGHAEEVVKEALTIEPKNAEALVLLARVKLDQTLDFEAAEKLVADALAVDPKIPGAHAVRAGLALHDGDLTGAETSIQAGLAVNPNDLELLSLRAATRYLADDMPGYAAAKADVLKRNPEYAQLYEIVGDIAEWEHRYDDIVTMMKEAVKLDPDDGKAWAQLGLTEQRGGDETAGLEALRKAWSKDHFNVRVFNTLNLYEQTIPSAYDMGASGVFKVRYPKDEKPVLERYVPRMLGEAWGSMKGRYGFVPVNPVQVELYGSREQFSVRTSGLPNIGIQGVCFGRVVAAMSPKSEPFNWGNVVWHELGHVFAIQLSKNHVPRWFTEGLSEYETIARRPEWQRELDPDLYLAIKHGTLPGAVDMNRAFTHASSGQDVTVAYYAASQMLVYTVETFGMPRVVRALALWGEGKRTPDVIQAAFGVSGADYDKGYRAWQLARLSRFDRQFIFDDRSMTVDEARAALAKQPNSAPAHAALALALGDAHKLDEAKKEVETALKIDPNDMQSHYIAAKLVPKDPEAQRAHMVAIQKAGGDGYVVRMGLAGLAKDKKDAKGLRAALEAARNFDPRSPDPVRALYELAVEEKREADELPLLRELAPLDQHDRKTWRTLLHKLVVAKQWDEATRVGEAAMFVDVERAGTHLDYAKALAAVGRHAEAAFELDSTLVAGPSAEEKQEASDLLKKEKAAAGGAPHP